jgi:hypothetical protein
MNFDGLTDSVTNLVGNMILLVVLLLGVTREHIKSGPPQLAEQPPAPVTHAGPRTLDALLLQIQALRVEISNVDREIREFEESRILPLRDRAQALLDKAGANRD